MAGRTRLPLKTLVAMPMKDPRNAKTRLTSVLDDEARASVALALFKTSQQFFANCYPGLDRLVITPSVSIGELARSLGAIALHEPKQDGLNSAVSRAHQFAVERHYDRLVIVPCDIISWCKSETDALFDDASRYDVVIARSSDGGTNGLSLRVHSTFAFKFGQDSANSHIEEAKRRGLASIDRRFSSLSRDLDNPSDYWFALSASAGWRRQHHTDHCRIRSWSAPFAASEHVARQSIRTSGSAGK